MRKMLALTLVLVAASTVNAQLNIWYDVRPDLAAIDNPAGTPWVNTGSLSPYIGSAVGQVYPLQNIANPGGRGDGQMVWISPKLHDVCDYTGLGLPDGLDEHWISAELGETIDWSTNSFSMWAEFIGTGNEVVSSIGVDANIPAAAFAGAVDGVYHLTAAVTTIENASLWSGYAIGGGNASTSIKMVQVPVIAGTPNPTYDATAGIHAGSPTTKIATVAVTSDYRNGAEGGRFDLPTTYGLFLSQNSLLITKVANPGPAGALAYNFGYAGGLPEDGTNNQSADMVINVVRKGDFDLDGAAATGIDDYAYYGIAANFNGSNCNPYEMWLGDFYPASIDGGPATGIDDYEYFKHSYIP